MYQQIQTLLDSIGSYPEKPRKPVLHARANSDAIRAYAEAFAEFERKFAEFEAQREAYIDRQLQVHSEIEDLIRKESGLYSIPEQYRKKVWDLAWEEGHSAGYHEVYQWLCRLVEIFEN